MAHTPLFTFCLAALGVSLVAASGCPYGQNSCVDGYVWRETFSGDYVCVPPADREQARADNLAAWERVEPNGGPFGKDTCLPGYKWRLAGPNDHVCVTPQIYQQTQDDNTQAPFNVECDCADNYTQCEQRWFGTAPLCAGACDQGWTFVRASGSADHCDQSQRGYCIVCEQTGNPCWQGQKVLCERCSTGISCVHQNCTN